MTFDKEIVLFNLDSKDSNDALNVLAEEFIKADVVNNDFKDALLKREAIYPTGLMLDNMGVAIPHADPEYVKKTQLGFARLKKPVTFKYMGDPSINVSVDLIFMMAIKEEQGQTEMLSKLMDMFTNNELMDKFKMVKDLEAFKELIKEANIDK